MPAYSEAVQLIVLDPNRSEHTLTGIRRVLTGMLITTACFIPALAAAPPVALFTSISYSPGDNSPPPPDALAVFESTLDVTGLASAPAVVTISIPRPQGNFTTSVQLERMDRREGFYNDEPIPGLPAEQFSYSWAGRGNGYDLRLTIHRGYAVGVLSGVVGRFGIDWDQVKEIDMSYYAPDHICAHNFEDDLPCTYDNF